MLFLVLVYIYWPPPPPEFLNIYITVRALSKLHAVRVFFVVVVGLLQPTLPLYGFGLGINGRTHVHSRTSAVQRAFWSSVPVPHFHGAVHRRRENDFAILGLVLGPRQPPYSITMSCKYGGKRSIQYCRAFRKGAVTLVFSLCDWVLWNGGKSARIASVHAMAVIWRTIFTRLVWSN